MRGQCKVVGVITAFTMHQKMPEFQSILRPFVAVVLCLLIFANGCAHRSGSVSRQKSLKSGDVFEGNCSWYGKKFHGRLTANGERFDMHAMTAAHKHLPFNTRLRVTNLANGRSLVLRINDRGPFVPGRVLDVSKAAAKELGFLGQGGYAHPCGNSQ